MKKLAGQVVIVIIWFGLATPLYAVEIINNVSSSASAGGNSVSSGGEVTQGESKAQVKIYTEVDGVAVEDIDETVSAPAGGGANIEKKSEINLSSVNVETSTNPQVEASTLTGASGGNKVTEAVNQYTGNAEVETERENSSFISVFFTKVWKYVLSIFTI